MRKKLRSNFRIYNSAHAIVIRSTVLPKYHDFNKVSIKHPKLPIQYSYFVRRGKMQNRMPPNGNVGVIDQACGSY